MAEDRTETGSEKSLWRAAARTHLGLRRESNQDRFLIAERGEDHLLVAVADGMGGVAGGEVASRLGLEVFEANLAEGGIRRERLREAVLAADNAITGESVVRADLAGMGTTLVALEARADGMLSWLNVGDSRIYRAQGESLEQISSDHSLVADLVRARQITPEEAETHPRRNVLTMALGADKTLDPETGDLETVPGDRFLLCSDGLHGMIPDRDIARILTADWDINARCDSLVEAALDAGGTDNVTVLILERHPSRRAAVLSGGDGAAGNASTIWLSIPLALILLLLILRLLSSDGGFGYVPVDPAPSDTTHIELDLPIVGDQLLDSNTQLTPGDIVRDPLWSDSLSQDSSEMMNNDDVNRRRRP